MSGKISQFFSEEGEKESQLFQLKEDIKKLELVRNKLSKYKIVEDLMDHVLKLDKLDPQLKRKIKNVCLSVECSKYSHSNLNKSSQQATNLLGVDLSKVPDLSYSEQQIFQRALQSVAIEHGKSNAKRTSPTLEIDSTYETLFDLQQQISEQQQLYFQNLQLLEKQLEKLSEFRQQSPEIVKENMEQIQLITKKFCLQSKILEQSTQNEILGATKNAPSAYKQVLKDIKIKQMKTRESIKKCEELKVKYNLVDSPRFREIINEYKEIKRAIEKKEAFEKIMNQ